MIFRIFSRVLFWKPTKNYSCPRKCLLRFNEYILQFPVSLWGPWVWHIFVFPKLCPELCSAAGMEGIWLHSISDCKSLLCADPLMKRIPHCATASKPQCKALGLHEINPPGDGCPEIQFMTLTANICVPECRSTLTNGYYFMLPFPPSIGNTCTRSTIVMSTSHIIIPRLMFGSSIIRLKLISWQLCR